MFWYTPYPCIQFCVKSLVFEVAFGLECGQMCSFCGSIHKLSRMRQLCGIFFWRMIAKKGEAGKPGKGHFQRALCLYR